MTRFLHAQLHQTRLRNLVVGRLAGEDDPPQPAMARCPACRTAYFADLEPAEEPWERELADAVAKLAGECPDHPHWFLVGW